MTKHSVTTATWLALAALAVVGCTPFEVEGAPPVAMAGDDLTLNGASVSVTLDASGSMDPDGQIVAYQWRFTGAPADYMGDSVIPDDPVEALLAELPAFCGPVEQDPEHPPQVPIRYCPLVADPGNAATVTLTLSPGGYRFTVWVTDNSGRVDADTVEVVVLP